MYYSNNIQLSVCYSNLYIYIYIYIYIYTYTVKPLYKKNLFIRTFFTHFVGIQHFPH